MCAFLSEAPWRVGLASLGLGVLSIGLIPSVGVAAPLSFNEAVALASQQAPSLAARERDLAAAKSAAVAAGRLPDPKLRLGLESFPVSGPAAGRFGPESMTQATIGVMQDLPSGERRQAERQRAAADISMAEAKQRLEARNVRLAAALAWLDVAYAHRRLIALGEIAKTIALMRTTAPAGLASYALTPAQALEAERQAAQLADRRASLNASLAKARAELGRWTGDADADAAGEPPTSILDPVALRANLDALPELRGAAATARQAEAEFSMAKAAAHSDWSVEASYGKRDARWGDLVSLGATVSLPLFKTTRQAPLIAAKSANAASARADQEATRRELRASLDADLAEAKALDERADRARSVLLPLLERQAQLERTRYAAAAGALSDALQAQAALAEARLDLIDREADSRRAALRIALTYGASDQ